MYRSFKSSCNTCLITALIFLFGLQLCFANSEAKIFYLEESQFGGELNAEWYAKLVRLTLEKTRDEYGPYEIRVLPRMSFARQWKSLSENYYPNFIVNSVYKDETLDNTEIYAIDFPMQLGLLGYRVCFHSATPSELLMQMLAQGRLKRLSYGQGADWSDVKILRFNGYKVLEVPLFDSLFKMNAAGRFDLFCRGVNEIYDEYHSRARDGGLVVEQSFAFHYPYPVFMHLNKSNKQALARLTAGIRIAHRDGSIMTHFLEHYGKRLDFVKLHNRKIIPLKNPLINTLDSDYQKYLYQF